MIQYDELPLLTGNKTASDIQLLYEDMDDKRIIFRESCKNFILDFISDWASEDEPYECDIFTEIDNSMHIETNIIEIFRDEEKELRFNVGDDDVSLDYFKDEELLQIIEQLDKS